MRRRQTFPLILLLLALFSATPTWGQNTPATAAAPQAELIFSALFGDDLNDYDLHDFTVGPDGSSYICGIVNFGDPDTDAFLARINSDGSAIDWALFYGGSPNPDPGFGNNWANSCQAVVIDDAGVLHAVGYTGSPDFPTIDGWDATHNGSNDIYYTKVRASDGAALYATFYGGSEFDWPNDVALHPEGGIVLTGRTTSPDIPIMGGFQSQLQDSRDVIIARFDEEGDLTHSTFLGGAGRDEALALAVDGAGNVIVAGDVEESTAGFPFVDAFRSAFDQDDDGDAMVAILSPDLGAVGYSTLIGGSDDDEAEDVAIRPDGSLAIVGRTRSDDLAVLNAYQPNPGGGFDGFLAVIGTSGSLESLSYIGGGSGERVVSIDVDPDGALFIAGSSSAEDLFNVDALQGAGGRSDAFVLALEPDLTTVRFASLLGGDDLDLPTTLNVVAAGEFIVGGTTESNDFPVQGFRDASFDGEKTGVFLTRISTAGGGSGGGGQLEARQTPLVFVTTVGNEPIVQELTVSNTGQESATIQSVTVEPDTYIEVADSGAPFDLGPGETSALSVTYTPPANILPDQPVEAEITIVSTASNSDLSVPVKVAIVSTQQPYGLAIHPDEPTPDAFPPRSDFDVMTVSGSGLADIDLVSFDPADGIILKSLEASDDRVRIELAVEHSAELGEREFKLHSSTSAYEIDVSEFVDWEFFITRAKARFNQSVDAAELPDPWTNLLVADKAGVLQVQLEDPSLHGEDFFGSVLTEDAEDTNEFVGYYKYRPDYTSPEIERAENYLSMPFGRVKSGELEFSYVMSTTYGIMDKIIAGPTLRRDARPSRSLKVAALRYRITAGQNTYEPASVSEIRDAFDYVRGVYPISHDSLKLRILTEPRDLPDTLITDDGPVPTWEIVERSDDSMGPILTKEGKSEIPERVTWGMLRTETDVVAIFLPNRTADRRDENGDIKGINGFARSSLGVMVIGRVGGGFGRTTAHEIGHMIGSIFELEVNDSGKDLGDEYDGGWFQCEVNPPVEGLKDWNDRDGCPDSPLADGTDGDRNGTYTDESSFNTASFVPVVTNTSIDPKVSRYNIMSGGQPDNISWTDVRSYSEMLKSLVPRTAGGASLKTDNLQAVAVSGSVNSNGSARISSATLVTRPVIPVSDDGQYRLALTAPGGGAEWSSNSFDLEFVDVSEPPSRTDRVDFLVHLPTNGVDPLLFGDIQLIQSGVGVIAEMSLTTSAPVVSNLAGERVGDGSGDVDLSWEASDADSAPESLTYGVFYVGEDDGLVAVETGLRTPEYRWQTVADGPNDDPRVVIIASDGFNQNRAELDLGFGVGVNSEIDTPGEMPNTSNLASNYPNPFSGQTTIGFSLSHPDEVELRVYDVLGRLLRTAPVGRLDVGINRIEFQSDGLMPGTYFYVVSGDGVYIPGRMTVAPGK